MRLKEIKVGHDYAIAAPRSLDRQTRIRGRVTQLKVHGRLPDVRGAGPQYVEFMVVEDPRASLRRLRDYRVNVVGDECREGIVYRCLASHVLCSWPNQLRQWLDDEVHRKAQEARDQRLWDRAEKIRAAFRERGFECKGCDPDWFAFDLESALRLLAEIDPENARWLKMAADLEAHR